MEQIVNPLKGNPQIISPGLIIDASILEEQEAHKVFVEDVKQNRIEFVFPDGINQVDLFDECRALTKTEDFETMFDLTMSMLHGKPVVIKIINYDGSKSDLCRFQIVDRYMDLRSIPMLDSYPCLVTWLTQFMGAYISKKYPQPGKSQPQAQAAEIPSGKKTKRRKGMVSQAT